MTLEYGSVHFEWDGVSYEHDPIGVTTRQAIVITGYTGLSLTEWETAYLALEVKACVALYWVIKDEAGERNDITDMGDDFPILKFMRAYMEAYAIFLVKVAEMKKAEEAANPKGSKRGGPRAAGKSSKTSAG